MSQFFQIHPDNPQGRLVAQAANVIRNGGVVVYPTDSAYAIGCHLDDKSAAERIRRIRQLQDKHNFTLMCRDLSDIALYAKVDNDQYRIIKRCTPGPFTFILNATKEVPRRLMHPKRKTIGLRVPQHNITQALLTELGEPMMSTTLWLPDHDRPLNEAWEIREALEHFVDLVIDGGACETKPSTVVSMINADLEILREGLGEPALLG